MERHQGCENSVEIVGSVSNVDSVIAQNPPVLGMIGERTGITTSPSFVGIKVKYPPFFIFSLFVFC